MRADGHKIRLWYGVFLSVFTVAIAFAFIIEAAQIYYGGEGYSRELVGEKLLYLLAPFILWILAVVGGFVLAVLFEDKEKLRVRPDARKSCRRLAGKIPLCEGEEFLAEKKQLDTLRAVRLCIWSFAAAFALATAIGGIVYLAKTSNFPANDPTGSVLNMVKYVLTFVAAAFVLFVGATVFDGISAKYELRHIKRLVALGKGAPLPSPTRVQSRVQFALSAVEARENVIVLGVRIAVAVLAVVFIAVGIWNGGMHDVLIKAVKICTECIGLG